MRIIKYILFICVSLILAAATFVAGTGAYSIIKAPEFLFRSEIIAEPTLYEDFTPKGCCKVPDGFLVCGNKESSEAGICFIGNDGKTSYTTLLDEYFDVFCRNAGGICFFDEFIYLASEDGIYVYYYEDFLQGIKEAEYYEKYETVGGADWCTVYDGMLYVGGYHSEKACPGEWEHTSIVSGRTSYSVITVFEVGESIRYGISPNPICIVAAPAEVQGMAICYEGVFLAIGSGGNSRLQMHEFNNYYYDYTTRIKNGEEINHLTYILDEETVLREISLPDTAEAVFCDNGYLYLFSGKCDFFMHNEIYGERIFRLPIKKEYFKK